MSYINVPSITTQIDATCYATPRIVCLYRSGKEREGGSRWRLVCLGWWSLLPWIGVVTGGLIGRHRKFGCSLACVFAVLICGLLLSLLSLFGWRNSNSHASWASISLLRSHISQDYTSNSFSTKELEYFSAWGCVWVFVRFRTDFVVWYPANYLSARIIRRI